MGPTRTRPRQLGVFFSVLLMDAGAGLAKRDALGAARSEERPVPGEPDGPKRPEAEIVELGGLIEVYLPRWE